jgi:hypothetical protein
VQADAAVQNRGRECVTRVKNCPVSSSTRTELASNGRTEREYADLHLGEGQHPFCTSGYGVCWRSKQCVFGVQNVLLEIASETSITAPVLASIITKSGLTTALLLAVVV